MKQHQNCRSCRKIGEDQVNRDQKPLKLEEIRQQVSRKRQFSGTRPYKTFFQTLPSLIQKVNQSRDACYASFCEENIPVLNCEDEFSCFQFSKADRNRKVSEFEKVKRDTFHLSPISQPIRAVICLLYHIIKKIFHYLTLKMNFASKRSFSYNEFQKN